MNIDNSPPDDSQLTTSNFLTRPVHIRASFPRVKTKCGYQYKFPLPSNLISKVPSGFGVIDVFELKDAFDASQ